MANSFFFHFHFSNQWAAQSRKEGLSGMNFLLIKNIYLHFKLEWMINQITFSNSCWEHRRCHGDTLVFPNWVRRNPLQHEKKEEKNEKKTFLLSVYLFVVHLPLQMRFREPSCCLTLKHYGVTLKGQSAVSKDSHCSFFCSLGKKVILWMLMKLHSAFWPIWALQQVFNVHSGWAQLSPMGRGLVLKSGKFSSLYGPGLIWLIWVTYLNDPVQLSYLSISYYKHTMLPKIT